VWSIKIDVFQVMHNHNMKVHYRYLQKKKEPWLKPDKEDDDDSDADSVASEEFEQFLHGSGQGGMIKDDEEHPDFADDVGGEFSDGDDGGELW
jgi:hypothetical protein